MRKSLLAALIVTLVACGGDKATGPQSVAGSYTLQTVNGISTPAAVGQSDTQRLDVTAGTIILTADNKWSGTIGLRLIDLASGQVQDEDSAIPFDGGTYTLSGSSVTLNDPTEDLVFTGTVASGTMTLSVDLGFGSLTTLVYTR